MSFLWASRSSQAMILMALMRYQSKDNCHDNRHGDGFLLGLYSSAIFGGGVVMTSLCILGLTGKKPFIGHTIHASGSAIHSHFVFSWWVGLISPVAEELFFRAYLYTYLRKFGVITALVISTAAFSLCHYKGNHLPFIQMAGGILFGLVYEKSRDVITPHHGSCVREHEHFYSQSTASSLRQTTPNLDKPEPKRISNSLARKNTKIGDKKLSYKYDISIYCHSQSTASSLRRTTPEG